MIINPIPTVESVGGKGFQLTKLKEICYVPEFFLLSFENTLEIDEIQIQNQILTYFDANRFDNVAVRSSATLEDSAFASFAGMFETVLNVKRDNLIEAIRTVLESIKDIRVKEYCRLNNLDYVSLKMCVVVQRMVKSRVSGVCFTREGRDTNMMVLEACYGLGEALVSGLVTPDTYHVERKSCTIISQNIGYQKVMYNENCKDAPISVPFHRRNAKKLSDKEIEAVTLVALKIENKLGYYAADIEWAYEKDRLMLLQVRPFLGL